MAAILLMGDLNAKSLQTLHQMAMEGFEVELTGDLENDLERINRGEVGLILLEIDHSQKNKYDLLGKIRKQSEIPVLALSSEDDEIERIVLLELGADDCLAKPFNPRELAARLRALLRNFQASPPPSNLDSRMEFLQVDGLVVDRRSFSVHKDGEDIELTATEFNLLFCLLQEKGNVVSREEIMESILGNEYDPLARNIDMHVCKLRKKLGFPTRGRSGIKTIRGAGYTYVSG